MTVQVLFFIVGLLLLYFGAEWLVKGSSNLARSLGLSPIVIGLTVVAFGTSAPELVVSLLSSIKDRSMIAVGNVIGSNICNIALVLGLAATLQPIRTQCSVVKKDIPVMLGISVYLLLISLNSTIGRFEGVTLFAGIVLYTWYNYSSAVGRSVSSSDAAGSDCDISTERIELVDSRSRQILFIVSGIAGVVFGADLLINSAVAMMKALGVSEKFIGLTVVALGTSLPELATSVVAALRKEMDISIGNLVGSNVFNILSVLGAASMVRPIPIPGGFAASGLVIDYLVMIAVSMLPWLMMRKKPVVTRMHGIMLLCVYAGYVGWLILKS